MPKTRIIKRYANRKLYDTQHSRYITLEQISEMIRDGDDIKIVDNKTKEDLTSITLAQIIFEEEKRQRSFLPLSAMRHIIQSGGEWFAEAQRRVQSMFPSKWRDSDTAPDLADASSDVQPDDATRHKRSLVALREWALHSKQRLADWQQEVDGKIRGVVEGIHHSINPWSGVQKDVQSLTDRIAELEAKLYELERQESDRSRDA